MKLFLFTTDGAFAAEAEQGGIYSIIVDWENKGKAFRQKHTGFEINADTPEDVEALSQQLKIPVTVRINPLSQDTASEVELALKSGARIIMLPMAKSATEVAKFLEIVNKRAETLVQIETMELVADMAEFAKLDWDFAYIGLNDLMISRSGTHIWEFLADGGVEKIFSYLKGRQYGFGGVTVVDGGTPLKFSLLLQEYLRLGCSLSLMRRTFKREVQDRSVVVELQKIHDLIQQSKQRDAQAMQRDHQQLETELAKLNKKVIQVAYSTHTASEEHLLRLQKLAPDYEVVAVHSEAEALIYAPRTEIILGHRYLNQTVPLTAVLRWVHTTAAGVDRLPLSTLAEKQVLLTRNSESSTVIASHAMRLLKAIQSHSFDAVNKTALIVGFGQIGQQIARLIHKDYRVLAVQRTEHETPAGLAEQIFTTPAWKKLLPQVDVVFLSLPLTVQTKQFLSKALLEQLPDHALIVNVGRGDTLDEAALVQLLQAQKLGGYATDVLGTYLSDMQHRSEALATKRVHFTDYVAANYPERGANIERFVETQLEKYLHHAPLQNVVDYHHAY